MKFNPKVSLFLCAMFLNCTVNASSDDEMDMDLDAYQHRIELKADSNNNTIKRKKFKTNKKLVRTQNKATKRKKDESNTSVNCTVYYDQPKEELNVQNPEEMDYLCDLLANINVGASCEERKFKTGNH